MMVHSYGPGTTLASLHVEVDGDADIFLMHDAIDRMERQLYEEAGVHATIHMDPIVTNDPEVTRLRGEMQAAIRSIDERLDLHDFRMVKGPTHSNFIFDVVVPFELRLDESDLKRRIEACAKALDETYCTVVTVDRA